MKRKILGYLILLLVGALLVYCGFGIDWIMLLAVIGASSFIGGLLVLAAYLIFDDSK